jgi:transposase
MPSMPQPVGDDQDNSVAEEVVLGVDTHKDVHVAAVLTTLGVLLSTKNFPATAAGYQALLDWVGTFGVLRRTGVECTGLLRCSTGPAPAGGRCDGDRGQPARQSHPPPTR